jgi:hypothetical protein
LKNSVRIFVEKIYKMVFLEGSGVPVLYIGQAQFLQVKLSQIILGKLTY